MPRTVRAFLSDLLALTLGFAVASLSMTVLVAARATSPSRVPSASVLTPRQDEIVSGTVVVSATATGDTDALQFQLNGANLGPAITSGQCSMSWNTAASSDGNYALTVLAFDGGGNVSSSASVGVTVANSAPQITNVATSSATATSVVLTWNTNQPSTSGVDYGIGGLTSSLPINWNLVSQHSAALTGLSPGTTYRFRVTSANGGGLQAGSAEYAFATASSDTSPASPSGGTTSGGTSPGGTSGGGKIGSPVSPAPTPPVTPPVTSPVTPPPTSTVTPPAAPLAEPKTIDSVAADPVIGVFADVTVTLERAGKTVATTTTDANGRYRFTGLFPGRYKVWAWYAGTKLLILDVSIK
ncbi:MAG TPA: carboxypeptidase regulatory-like domain-containing protein [Vicinamibacterales bacterium]|nr:carboxypeptidase regulatory-like domain-containing protein [Vicinamibacterales bacterium]